MKKKLNIVSTALFLSFSAHAQVLCKWDAESTRNVPARFDCFRGETLVFQPAYRQYNTLVTNVTETLYWQTNGMLNTWWTTNVLQFTPAMDVGASSYTAFIRAVGTNGVSYRANGIITMRHAPGFTPNALALPVQTIDFAATSYVNAPWVLPSSLANSNNWDTAFAWGNHAGLYRPIAYVPAWSEVTDKPTTFPPASHNQSYTTITDSPWALATALANSNNWDTAFGWGNHAGLYRPIAYVPAWSEVTDKPTEFTPSAHNQSYTTITDAPWAQENALNLKADATHTNDANAHASLFSAYLPSSMWVSWLGTNQYLKAVDTNAWTVSAHTFWKDSHVIILPTNLLSVAVSGPSIELSNKYWVLTNSASWYASTGHVAITTLDGSYLVDVDYSTFKSRDGDLFPQESTLNSFRRVSDTQFVLSAWCADGGMGSYYFAISNIVAYTYDDNTVTPGSVTNDAAAIVSRVDDPDPDDKRGAVNRNTMEAYLESQKALIAKSAWNYTPSGSVRPDTEVCTIDQPMMQQGLISYIQSGDCYAQSAVGDQYYVMTTGSVWRVGPSGRTMLELASTNKLLRISEFSVSDGFATLTINTNICYGIPFIEQCKNLLNQQWITDPNPNVSIVGSNYVIIVSATADAKFYRAVCVGGEHKITSYARHYAPYGLVGDLEGNAATATALSAGTDSNRLSGSVAHTNRTDNPHSVTAAQAGALTNNSLSVAFSNLTVSCITFENGMSVKAKLNNNGTNGIIIMQPNDANEYMIWLPPPPQ